MAKQTTVTITSDLDGAPNAKTREFYDFEGKKRSIDLTDEQWDLMRDVMQPYIAKSERVYGPEATAVRKTYGTGPKRNDTKKKREWLREHGVDISDRGRIPIAYEDAYEAFERFGTIPSWSKKNKPAPKEEPKPEPTASMTAPAANKTTEKDIIAERTEAIEVPAETEKKPAPAAKPAAAKKTTAKAKQTAAAA